MAGAGYISDALNVGANSTAPVGAFILATITPPAGTYEIRVTPSVGAGAVAADNGNMRLDYNGGVKLAALPTTGTELIFPRITLDGTNPLRVVVVNAATAAVVYTARITATQLD